MPGTANQPESSHEGQGEKKRRGFAAMDKDRQRQIASKGGKAAHAKGTAHEFTPEEAAKAGRAAHASGHAHEFTPEEAAEAGRKGGKARAANRAARLALDRARRDPDSTGGGHSSSDSQQDARGG